MVRLRVKELLEERGKDMAWLARETGRSYQSIHAVTKEETTAVKFETLELLCNAFRCEPGELVHRETEIPAKPKRKRE